MNEEINQDLEKKLRGYLQIKTTLKINKISYITWKLRYQMKNILECITIFL